MPRPKDPALVDHQATQIRLPRELHNAVQAQAREEDRTMSQLIRVALRKYLADADRQRHLAI